jgi:hypothetical protein
VTARNRTRGKQQLSSQSADPRVAAPTRSPVLAALSSRQRWLVAGAALLVAIVLFPKTDWVLRRPRAMLLDVEVIRGNRAEIWWDRPGHSQVGWRNVLYLGQGMHEVEMAQEPASASTRAQQIRCVSHSLGSAIW